MVNEFLDGIEEFDREIALIAIETVDHLKRILNSHDCPECSRLAYHMNWCQLGQHLNRKPIETGG